MRRIDRFKGSDEFEDPDESDLLFSPCFEQIGRAHV